MLPNTTLSYQRKKHLHFTKFLQPPFLFSFQKVKKKKHNSLVGVDIVRLTILTKPNRSVEMVRNNLTKPFKIWNELNRTKVMVWLTVS